MNPAPISSIIPPGDETLRTAGGGVVDVVVVMVRYKVRHKEAVIRASLRELVPLLPRGIHLPRRIRLSTILQELSVIRVMVRQHTKLRQND